MYRSGVATRQAAAESELHRVTWLVPFLGDK